MILVTGGTGFVGRRVVAALAGRGHHVRVLTRRRAAAQDLPVGIDIAEADLLDSASVTAALSGVRVVVHLAAVLGGEQLTRINVDAARAMALAARRAGVQAFVHCSSAGVYGDGHTDSPHRESDQPRPASAYERSKLAGEQAVIAALGHEIPWVVLRPAGVYGPGRQATLEFYRLVLRRRLWIHGPARVIVHPTFVEDVSQAVAALIERPIVGGDIINVGGERALSYPALIDLTAAALGAPVRQIVLPRAVQGLATGLQRLGLRSASLDRLSRPIINRAVDTTKARDRLDLRPTPLVQGIEQTVASFRQQKLL